MKKVFSYAFVAAALALTVAACNSNKTNEEGIDSTAMDTTMTVDTMSAPMDTTSMDTTVTTGAADTAKAAGTTTPAGK